MRRDFQSYIYAVKIKNTIVCILPTWEDAMQYKKTYHAGEHKVRVETLHLYKMSETETERMERETREARRDSIAEAFAASL